MARDKRRTHPNHVPAVLKAAERALARGKMEPGLYVVRVRHEDWCDLVKGKGPCNCDPSVQPPVRREGK